MLKFQYIEGSKLFKTEILAVTTLVMYARYPENFIAKYSLSQLKNMKGIRRFLLLLPNLLLLLQIYLHRGMDNNTFPLRRRIQNLLILNDINTSILKEISSGVSYGGGR